MEKRNWYTHLGIILFYWLWLAISFFILYYLMNSWLLEERQAVGNFIKNNNLQTWIKSVRRWIRAAIIIKALVWACLYHYIYEAMRWRKQAAGKLNSLEMKLDNMTKKLYELENKRK